MGFKRADCIQLHAIAIDFFFISLWVWPSYRDRRHHTSIVGILCVCVSVRSTALSNDEHCIKESPTLNAPAYTIDSLKKLIFRILWICFGLESETFVSDHTWSDQKIAWNETNTIWPWNQMYLFSHIFSFSFDFELSSILSVSMSRGWLSVSLDEP